MNISSFATRFALRSSQMFDFAYYAKKNRELEKRAKAHFFQMFIRRVLYEWFDAAQYVKRTKANGIAVAAKVLYNFKRRHYKIWFHQWWDKETEHRADVHGLMYTITHYFRRFHKASTTYKNERIASYAIQKNMRRYLARKKGLIEKYRVERRDKFTTGRVGMYLEDSKVEETIKSRDYSVLVEGSFISEQIRRRKSFFMKMGKVRTPFKTEIWDQILSRLIGPKFYQYAFPAPLPSRNLADRMLKDELGVMLRKPIETDLNDALYFREACDAISKPMALELTTLADDSPFPPVNTSVSYRHLLGWMEENLCRGFSGFQPNLKELVKSYIHNSSKETRKTFISDPSERAAAKFLGVSEPEVRASESRSDDMRRRVY